MKAFLVVSVCLLVGSGHAGVRELSPQEEQMALQLFAQICAGGSEGTNLGDTLVYCKRARGENTENLEHTVTVPPSEANPGQVVFVQPPPVKYVHKVAISGQGAAGQQAKIYVLPQKATHELQAQYQGGASKSSKPVVYFLKGEGGSSSGGSGGAPGGGAPGGGAPGGGAPGGGAPGGGAPGGGAPGGGAPGGSGGYPGGNGGSNGGAPGGSGGAPGGSGGYPGGNGGNGGSSGGYGGGSPGGYSAPPQQANYIQPSVRYF